MKPNNGGLCFVHTLAPWKGCLVLRSSFVRFQWHQFYTHQGLRSVTKAVVTEPTRKEISRTHFDLLHSENAVKLKNIYVPLHVHSEYSLLDGASHVKDLVKRAKSLCCPALALTDHGVMFGVVELIEECMKNGIKPIAGNEFYIMNGDISIQAKKRRYHLTVLAKNGEGYRNLSKLTTISHLKGVQRKGIMARPCISKDYLKQHSEGLIVLSGCLAGEIPQAILQGDIEKAVQIAKWYQDSFGEDFYLEIQNHGLEQDKVVIPKLYYISKMLGIKLVATNDSHFTDARDSDMHDCLLCIQTAKKITDEKRMRYTGTEYFRTFDEMLSCFDSILPERAIREALWNSTEIAERIETYDIFGEMRFPEMKLPMEFENKPDAYLKLLTYQGLVWRFSQGSFTANCVQYKHEKSIIDEKTFSVVPEQYLQRLEEELNIVKEKGFTNYFLIVWDYVSFARQRGIRVGPGRGSAAGSLIAYALFITNIDPIRHGLLFERFLNPERMSLPDIDIDFSMTGKDEIIRYLKTRYGEEHVAQIITFNKLASRAALKDVGRVLGFPYKETEKLSKEVLVTRGKPTSLEVMISEQSPSKLFRDTYLHDENVRKWIDLAIRIEGTTKSYGVHAAGVVISPEPLDNLVPLARGSEGEVITQYAMEDIEALGLLKMDLLGLKTLSIIEETIKLITAGSSGNGPQPTVDLDTIGTDDRATYKLLCEGEVDGVFQLDASPKMKQIIQELSPNCLEDISSAIALYRPGPLDAGLIPSYIKRKLGKEKVEFLHSVLEPILSNTYGILMYQEQIMQVARIVAGYSMGQADILRRAMGKKKSEAMESERKNFVKGAIERNYSQSFAEELFEQMLKFAEYCFNKSHSTAYAYITYQTAFLKANYPQEYLIALFNHHEGDMEKISKFSLFAARRGIEMRGPCIHASAIQYSAENGENSKAIRAGLASIKNVGYAAAKAIVEEREKNGPFESLEELCNRVDHSAVTKRTYEALILSGAMDKIDSNRNYMQSILEEMVKFVNKKKKKATKTSSKKKHTDEKEAVFVPSIERSQVTTSLMDAIKYEREYIGFTWQNLYKIFFDVYPLLHPVPIVDVISSFHPTNSTVLVNDSELNKLYEQLEKLDGKKRHAVKKAGVAKKGRERTSRFISVGLLQNLKVFNTKRGDTMATFELRDPTGICFVKMYPRTYSYFSYLLMENEHFAVRLYLEQSSQLLVEDISKLSDIKMADNSPPFRFAYMRQVVASLPSPLETAKVKLSNKNIQRTAALSKASHAVFSSFPDFSLEPNGLESESFQKLQEELDANLLSNIKEENLATVKLVSSLVFPFLVEGLEDMVDDSFTKCFQRKKELPWNWNFYLFPAWLLGLFVRYAILFPIRLLCLVLSTLLLICVLPIIETFIRDVRRRREIIQRCLVLYAGAWIMSLSGVVRYHGMRPRKGPHRVYIANHTTMIDFAVLLQIHPFAVLGQLHGGLVGFLQTYLLEKLGCIWFRRDDLRDRDLVRKRLKEYLKQSDVPPLLIFPEGTCVNNEYCVMFKKGAFELDATIYPVAIKYHREFSDAFWDSKSENFLQYLFRLMTSWALVCDIYFLSPQNKQPEETPEEFAARVKSMICQKAGLNDVPWDGYMKHFRPSEKFVEKRRLLISRVLLAQLKKKSMKTPTL
eukprot:jgi/Galph1/272/GphlegSOOS_G5061.1